LEQWQEQNSSDSSISDSKREAILNDAVELLFEQHGYSSNGPHQMDSIARLLFLSRVVAATVELSRSHHLTLSLIFCIFRRLKQILPEEYKQCQVNTLAFVLSFPLIRAAVLSWNFGETDLENWYQHRREQCTNRTNKLQCLSPPSSSLLLNCSECSDNRREYPMLLQFNQAIPCSQEELEERSQIYYENLRLRMISYAEQFTYWKKSLKPQIDFNTHIMWNTIVIGLIRQRIKNFVQCHWDPRKGKLFDLVCITLLELFQDDLPLEDLIVHWIVPKLKQDIDDKWQPTSQYEDQSTISWLDDWTHFLGPKFSETLSLAMYNKLEPILRLQWDISDYSASVFLRKLQNCCPLLVTKLIENVIVPKLDVSLKRFVILPSNQSLDVWWHVMSWRDIVDHESFVSLLLRNFFPKWHRALHLWLYHNRTPPHYLEIVNWYRGWKELFILESLFEDQRIRDQFTSALHVMNLALVDNNIK
jgi:hypothetical protein